MNYRGSYRKLIANSISAMMACMEIYNKPRFSYRNEVVSVLITNAWELLFKAIVSKSGQTIYYPKRRNEPYRTISIEDAMKRAVGGKFWPPTVDAVSVVKNVELLVVYRNKTIHFYNDEDFGLILYSLMQTSILNYRDIVKEVFSKDMSSEMDWQILPLGTRPPIDPVEYLSTLSTNNRGNRTSAANEFIGLINSAMRAVEEAKQSTDRLLTVFTVNLQSVKKVSAADVVVGIDAGDNDAVIVERRIDPNVSHPYRQKEVLAKIDKRLTVNSYSFQAIVSIYNLRGNPTYCWTEANGTTTKWSGETVAFINRLTRNEIDEARTKYTSSK